MDHLYVASHLRSLKGKGSNSGGQIW